MESLGLSDISEKDTSMILTLYETFRHWSDGGSVWIISDTHFDDADCKLMNPNWITPKEQVDLINRHVQKNDCLIHLGDVGDPNYINALNVRKRVLLLGDTQFHMKQRDEIGTN